MTHLLSYRSAAQMLGLGVRTVEALVARRSIPHVRIGSRVLFDPADLRRWVEQHRVPVEVVSIRRRQR